ncbi:MAG: response regulator [Pseudomonadota bacterium]
MNTYNRRIICGVIALAAIYWLADSLWSFASFETNLKTLVFSEPRTLLDAIMLRTTPYQVVSRLMITTFIVLGGWLFHNYTMIQRKSREAIKKSEERLRSIFDAATFPICVVRKNDGRILFCNNHIVKILFNDVSSALASDIKSVFVDFEYDHRVLGAVENGTGHADIEAKLRTNKGDVVWCILSFAPMTYQDNAALFLAVVDITNQKMTEQALKQSEERFRALSEESPLGITLINAEGRYEYVNPAFTKMFGYTLNDFSTGKEWFEIAYPNAVYRQTVIRAWLDDLLVQGEGATQSRVFEVRCKDESVKSILFRPVTTQTYGQFVLYEDITQSLQSEEEKAKLQAQLQQARKMEAVGTLAGGVAHDFNNLLQAINGYTELLLMKKSTGDPDNRYLTAIHKAGFRASDLVRQLLLFSRKAESVQKPIQLQREVEQAKNMLERTIPKMVHIQVNVGDRLWPILADPVQIEQLLLNLGSNAADSMPDGGKLLFEIENIVLDSAYMSRHLAVQPGEYVLLTVSDTGQGMDKETLDKIFDPFFTTKEFGKGTGLGLASVYGIVKSHGGYIDCYSDVGQGATFKIYFPAIVRAEVEETRGSEPKPIPRGAETVLLVDDEEAIRSLAMQSMVQFGYTVLTAATGEEALAIYSEKTNEIDLIVMDLGMPGMGGYRCLEELLKINNQVKVIIASGYSINGQVRKSMTAGARGYVGKPYKLSDLLNTVREVLDNRGEAGPQARAWEPGMGRRSVKA